VESGFAHISIFIGVRSGCAGDFERRCRWGTPRGRHRFRKTFWIPGLWCQL